MAAETGFSHTTIRRMWVAFGLQPHRSAGPPPWRGSEANPGPPAARNNYLARRNKCLAQNNKSSDGREATKERRPRWRS
jgi:hypothetical protein